MELRQVSYVVAVADEASFTRAARRLGVSQPTVSQAVRALERELGVDLFCRIGRTVVRSAAGEAFLGPARRLLREAETARAAVAAIAGLRAGRLDLVALPTVAADVLATLIGAFRARHPGVVVSVAEPETADEVATRVRSGQCELGIADRPADGGDLVAVPLGVQEILAVFPPGTELAATTVAVASLAGVPVVATPPGTSTRRLVDQAFASAGQRPNVAVETAHRESITALVVAGAGASFLPEPLARRAEAAGAVVAGLRPALRRELAILHRPAELSPAARAFLELAAAAGPAEVAGVPDG